MEDLVDLIDEPKGRRRCSVGLTGRGVMQLNVAGEDVDVPRTTLLLVPEDSILGQMFGDSWSSPPLETDPFGRIFLNFPPVSFKHIMNHLRLLDNTCPDDKIQ